MAKEHEPVEPAPNNMVSAIAAGFDNNNNNNNSNGA